MTARRLVAVINQTMANHFWAAQDPLGRRISIDEGETWIQIVGVVGDVRQYGLDRRPTSQVYVALPQYPLLSANVLLRSTARPMAMERLVREAVHGLDPDQAVDRFRTLEQVRANALASPRLTSILLGLFAVAGAGDHLRRHRRRRRVLGRRAHAGVRHPPRARRRPAAGDREWCCGRR